MADERMFPMQDGPAIPWSLAERIYRDYAFLYGSEQTLERLSERGGFAWKEVPFIFTDAVEKRRWQKARAHA